MEDMNFGPVVGSMHGYRVSVDRWGTECTESFPWKRVAYSPVLCIRTSRGQSRGNRLNLNDSRYDFKGIEIRIATLSLGV